MGPRSSTRSLYFGKAETNLLAPSPGGDRLPETRGGTERNGDQSPEDRITIEDHIPETQDEAGVHRTMIVVLKAPPEVSAPMRSPLSWEAFRM